MLKIVHAPHSVLGKKVGQVKKIDKKIRELVYDMEETLVVQTDPEGVGLAAPQVGVSLAIFIVKPTPKAQTEVFINPHILEVKKGENKKPEAGDKKQKSEEDDIEGVKLEGCLSVPRIWGPVDRNSEVLVDYLDLNGEKHTKWFSGLKAVIVQHETDHLHGILFTQRALEQKGKLYEEKNGGLEMIS